MLFIIVYDQCGLKTKEQIPCYVDMNQTTCWCDGLQTSCCPTVIAPDTTDSINSSRESHSTNCRRQETHQKMRCRTWRTDTNYMTYPRKNGDLQSIFAHSTQLSCNTLRKKGYRPNITNTKSTKSFQWAYKINSVHVLPLSMSLKGAQEWKLTAGAQCER